MQRSIGSLAKPAVYLTALNSGRFHWGSPVSDAPVSVSGPADSLWQPKNYDRKSHGIVPMVDAMARSLNQATARLGMTVGLEKVVHTFRQLGLKKTFRPTRRYCWGPLMPRRWKWRACTRPSRRRALYPVAHH